MSALFWVAIAALIYVYVGYPVMAAVIGMCLRRDVEKRPFEPTVTLIIAARNEAATIRKTVTNKMALDYPHSRLQIVVVSDASSDGTDDIVRECGNDRVLLLRQQRRRGKTAALNLAVQHATGEVLVFADANSIYAADALRKLLRNFADPTVGYVTGRLKYVAERQSTVGTGCRAYMAYEHRLRVWETMAGSVVGVNGGIDAVRRSLYQPMNEEQLPDLVLPLSVVGRGFRVVYEPEATLIEECLSEPRAEYAMRVRVALRALWALRDMRQLLNVRRHGLFALQLASHKVLRYFAFAALPLAYLGALFANGPGYRTCFVGMSLLIVLGGAGRVLERHGRANRLLSVPYYFLLINVAAAHAVFDFLRGRNIAVWVPRLG